MKKYGMVLAIVAGFWATASAQVREDKVTILGTEHNALRIDLNYPSKMVSTALSDKLKEAGVKSKNSKGLITATEAKLIEITPDLMDYYFRIGAIDKKNTVLYISMSKGYANFIDPALNASLWENAKIFLNNMVGFTATYQMKEDAKEIEKSISAAQKDYDKTVKAFKKQEDNLAESRKNMEAAENELNSKKSELDRIQMKLNR